MENNQNQQLSKCQHHSFSLRALYKDRKASLNASLTMCRGKLTKNKKQKSNCPNYEGPILNRDKCHATPAFILPSQKIDYLQSTREILRQHQKRVKQAEQDINELYIPKPRSKYCNVCRQNYQEYVDSISHKRNIRNCEFNSHILDLQKKFSNSLKKGQGISSTQSSNTEQIDDSVEIIGVSGRKKVKTDNQQLHNHNYYPFLNQNINYPALTNSFGCMPFPQLQYTCNPFTGQTNPNALYSSNLINRTNYSMLNGWMQQQCVNYPLFYMPVQRAPSTGWFQA